jgi:hypothetical protein
VGDGGWKGIYESWIKLASDGKNPSEWMAMHHDTRNTDFKEKDRLFCIDLEKSADKTIVAEP